MPKKPSVTVDTWYDEYEIEAEYDEEQDYNWNGTEIETECRDSAPVHELDAYLRPGRLPTQDQEESIASSEASLQSTPLASGRKLSDDLEDWEVCSPVVIDGPLDTGGDWHAVAVNDLNGDLRPDPQASLGAPLSTKPAKPAKQVRKQAAKPEMVPMTAEQKAAAVAAAQEAAHEKKEAKLKQLKDHYDVVLPHSANMKEVDKMLKIMQRQKVKKEVGCSRENQKMKKQADIRDNRQRTKSWDTGLEE